jgi:predicted ester cyclase
MSLDENKDLIRRYMQAVDNNTTSDWSVIDDYLTEDFVAHDPPLPGVSLDREGMKAAAEIFRVATPGRHEITMQVAEGDLVVSRIVGSGIHEGEFLGIPATNVQVETDGIAVHRVRDGKIAEYWAIVDTTRVLQQIGVLPNPNS